jgi:F-type H+-transporting ATPase subunit b
MSRRWQALLATCFAGLLMVGSVAAQDNADQRERVEHREQRAQRAMANDESGNANAGVAQILTHTTEEAAQTAESWGHRLGLGKDTSFAVSLGLNFAGIVIFVWLLLKSKLPQAFRERTASIQKGIKDAQAASADAQQRLSNIEARLSKLDGEVEAIRRTAEQDAVAEEERMRQAAAHDKQKSVDAAEAEIKAIARNAQRELKGYAASLAVDVAARRIHVDEPTDHVLVRDFVDQLGKDGH